MSEGLDPIRRAEIRDTAIETLFDLPESIGRYEIRGELGRGGMGVVYDGFDRSLNRAVAIKLIDEENLSESRRGDGEMLQRFEREMRATSQLFHPNLVAILDAGTTTLDDRQRAYYVMERIEGESLEKPLQRTGPLSRREGLRIAIAIARGLAEVHAQGLVHRDLKPSNILIPAVGEAKITDFGLCQWQPDLVTAQKEKGITGSPHYLAPEQVTEGSVGFRSDLFSLGAVLVHIFSGVLPFSASSLSAHLVRIVSDDPDGLQLLDRDIRELVVELLSKSPADRPDSAEVVARRLEQLAARALGEPWQRALKSAAIVTGVAITAALSIAIWAQRDLAQLRAETQLRGQELAIQLDRARALAPALASIGESADRSSNREIDELRDEATGTLNRIAIERRRYEQAASQLRARLDTLPWSLIAPIFESARFSSLLPSPPDMALRSESTVHDPDTHLDASELAEIEQQLRLLRDEFDVDARVLLVTPKPDQSIESFGIESFEALSEQRVSLGPTGLLMIVDGGSRRVRVDVGYALEPHLTDALAGALTRQHLAEVAAAAAQPGLDLRVILRIVRKRLRNAVLAGTFERPGRSPATYRFAAGGAGASAIAPGDAEEWFSGRAAEPARFGPAATVREAYDRYREWLRTGDFDHSVDLFTSRSQTLLADWRGTPVYLEQMSKSPIAGAIKVIERGVDAMLYPVADPLAPPHFFRRNAQGWQIDLSAREQHVIAIAGGSFTWSLSDINERPLSRFHDALEAVDGLIRVRGGDNRSLAAARRPAVAAAGATRS